MNFSSWLNPMKFAVGFLFVVLTSNSCTPAMAQVVEPQASTATEPDSAPTASAPDQQPTTASSATNWQDEGLDNWCCPSWNCCRPFCADPCCSFYAQVQALFLQRVSGFSNQPIVVNSFPGASSTFMSTSDLNSNFTPGVQATVGMPLGGGGAVEFDYFSLFPANSSAVAVKTDPGAVFTFPGDVGGNVFLNMDRVQADYSSWINSFGVNFLCCSSCCDVCCNDYGCCQTGDGCCQTQTGDQSGYAATGRQSFSWFGGFRYLNVGEKLNIAGQGVVPGETGSYNIRTSNNLYGVQLGARVRQTQGRFGWDATGQAGIFGNDAQQSQTVQDFPPGSVLRNVSSSQGGVAFVGQGNLSGLYALTNVWNLRAGYNVIWIEGLALAPDQLNFNFATAGSGSQVNNNGGLFLHGVNVGLEARW